MQLHRHPEAAEYLQQRGLKDANLVEELGLGYAPGGNLRRHRADCGYGFDVRLRTGLISNLGRDAFCRRVIFPFRQQGRVVNLLWPQYRRRFPTSPAAALPRRLVGLGGGELVLGGDPGGRPIGPGRALAGGLSQHHLRHRYSSDPAAAGAAERSASWEMRKLAASCGA